MAQAYQYAQQQSSRGTLVAGQTISVNKYTVQVERYLSQGGFAHVYLVRTAQPVYGTTHHVLKRIAVPNEAMLTEVKKEVDIMRILKGHPNIVHLIDAAWHRMSNGTFEVFILMEYCPGGGIIDMMNRRLRERLTEPEILTIFADVCEGLAAMHTLKPPLLHRDLKVENILQSSPTSYKLCDFGSATPVQRVPNNMAELRALEADLNRHTTLQYRAPEMVDVFLRRPIDEKSDVWALGVLLYKLCYYTTPFEEHGPLAILNVQYKIPPYPVYSQNMNNLIASMLREHGAQRPTVFEILNHVHALRGTKSRFTYIIPQPRHTVPTHAPSPRAAPLQTLSSNTLSPPSASSVSTNPLDDLVQFKPRSVQAITHPTAGITITKGNGIEARDRVLEAIAPMRRGRPTPLSSSTLTSTPQSTPEPEPVSPSKRSSRRDREHEKGKEKEKPFSIDMKAGFEAEEDRAWRGLNAGGSGWGLGLGVRGHKSGMASVGGRAGSSMGDAWGLGGEDAAQEKETKVNGFDSDFLSAGESTGFGDSFRPSPAPSRSPIPSSAKPPIQPSQPQQAGVSRATPSPIPQFAGEKRDAFDGLGISGSTAPPQTLGEVQRERSRSQLGLPPSTGGQGQHLGTGVGSANTTYRAPSHSYSPSPARSAKRPTMDISAEERFPSLEELDRTFLAGSTSEEKDRPLPTGIARASAQPAGVSGTNLTSGTGAGHLAAPPAGGRFDGVRSQHVTGIAMRESRKSRSRSRSRLGAGQSLSVPTSGGWDSGGSGISASTNAITAATETSQRPLPRRHRSSISIKPRAIGDSLLSPISTTTTVTSTTATSTSTSSSGDIPTLPPRPVTSKRDWLTGLSDDEQDVPEKKEAERAVLRASPRKRASYIEQSPVTLAKPLEAESGKILGVASSSEEAAREANREDERRVRERQREIERDIEREREREREREQERLRERERQQREELEKEKARQRERVLQAENEKTRVREQQQQQLPERGLPRRAKSIVSRTTGVGPSLAGGYALPGLQTRVTASVVSSVTPVSAAQSPGGLTENWSPVSPPPPVEIKQSRSMTSSSDEGPEDLSGYVPRLQQRIAEIGFSDAHARQGREEIPARTTRERSPEKAVSSGPGAGVGGPRRMHNGRQSSVHDLVDLWGGSSTIQQQQQDRNPVLPTKLSDKRRSAIVSSSSMKPPIRNTATPSLSQPIDVLSPSPTSAAQVHTTSRPLPRPPSTQQQRPESPAVKSSATILTPSASLDSGRSPAAIPRTRPQSMFINPIARTTPLESAVSQHSTSITEENGDKRRNTRRTSISNMVQRYEAISDSTSSKATLPPPVGTKPAGLGVKTFSTDTTSVDVPSPSAAATRFPKLSPPSSPLIPKATLAPPPDELRSTTGRTSPAPKLLARAPAVITKAAEQLTGTSIGGPSGRRTPLQANRISEPVSKAEERPPALSQEKRSTPESQVREPSPEKPYQGVSKLINRWQRAVDESSTTNPAPYGGFVAKKPGIAANDSLTGR